MIRSISVSCSARTSGNTSSTSASSLDQNPTLFQPVGGMDAIVDAFEERLEHLIRYRSIVRAIRKTAGGVRIVYRRRRRGMRVLEAGLCDLHHPRACSQRHPQRLLTRDAGRDRVDRVLQGGQNRVSRRVGASGRKITASMAAYPGPTRILPRSGIRPTAISETKGSSWAPISGTMRPACATPP